VVDLAKILSLFQYYKGEKECPFQERNSSTWWAGEELFYKMISGNPNTWERFKDDLIEGIEKGHITGLLADESIPLEQRVIVFFMDLWHGKWFPYDNWDVIYDYYPPNNNVL
jgi:glutamate/tyrosine decarboxylase-like PLP-dependent enzyme